MANPLLGALSAASAVSQAIEQASPLATRKTKEAAQQFESVFLTNMFEEMFAGVEQQEGPEGSTQGQAAWRSMLTEEYANTIAKSGGVGIADHVQRELLALQERNR